MSANVANIRRWVEALRSGSYEQTTGALRNRDSYCCLGVACEVSGLGEWRESDADRPSVYVISEEDRSPNYLPEAVRVWLGLSLFNPIVREADHLGNLNDSGMSFAEIADLIEAEWVS